MKHFKTVIIAIIIIGALIFILMPGSSQQDKQARGKEYSEMEKKKKKLFRPSDPLLAEKSMQNPMEIVRKAKVPREHLLKDYLSWARYPPNSRPLDEGHVDVLDYHIVYLKEQKMPYFDGENYVESDFSCVLQPSAHSVFEGESLAIYLSCRKDGSTENRNLKIKSYKVEGKAGELLFNPSKPVVGDNGHNGDETANDGIYTFLFTPDEDDWGDIFLSVKFEVAGDETGSEYELKTHFFASPETPATFTGVFEETVRDGSLYITVELDVSEEGFYTVEANLLSDEGPIAFARTDKDLEGGKQKVELEFFGKILHDKGIDGPYKLIGLRGQLDTGAIQLANLTKSPEEVAKFLKEVSDERPNRLMVPYYKEEYKTAAYKSREFSDKEYDSPEKQQRIELIQNLPE
ncbi:MAG: choice-of-anchor X domain-containing protein [Bacteroidota bacterium]